MRRTRIDWIAFTRTGEFIRQGRIKDIVLPPGTTPPAAGRFGHRVARIVEDSPHSWETPKRPWIDRKREYVEHAKTLSAPSLRVAAADKVHNAYAILRDMRNTGDQVWERFNAPADDVVAYYEGLVRSFRHAGGGKLVEELERIVKGIQREMGY